MSDALYNAAILRLKLAGEGAHRLPAPDGSAVKVSPVCGSKVVADVALAADGHIAALALDASRACTLGQAAAALVAGQAPGQSLAWAVHSRAALGEFLGQRAEAAPPGWEIFGPARSHRARHPSILLPLDALLAALADAGAKAGVPAT